MQNAPSIPHTWREFIWLSIVAILASGGTYLTTWFRRGQSKAETQKIEAEARSIDLNTTLHAGDMLLELMKQAATASANVENLRTQKEFWEQRAKGLEAEKAILERQLDDQIRIGKDPN